MRVYVRVHPSYRDVVIQIIFLVFDATLCRAQFFIPNSSPHLDQFQAQNPDPRFLDPRIQRNGLSANQPDGFGQGPAPTPQPSDQGFQGGSASNERFTDAAPTPVPKHLQPPPDFVCEETFGHYGDNQNCSRFFVCVFGLPVVQECSKGLHYNPQLGLCDWPKNTECPTKGSGFFAIPGTTTEGPIRATIPWWLQGEDAPPSRAPPPDQGPPQDTPVSERQKPSASNEFLQQQQQTQQHVASFPMGPSFPTNSLPSTRRPWWNPWQPNGQNNDTWPPHAPGSATTAKPNGNQQDFMPPNLQQDFAKFPQGQQGQSANERDQRPFGRPDSSGHLNPATVDVLTSRDLGQQRQDLFSPGGRQDFFGQSFGRQELSADGKPVRASAPGGLKARPQDSSSTQDLFSAGRTPSRQEQLDQLFGPSSRQPQSQTNDSPAPGRENSPSQFPDFGRQSATGTGTFPLSSFGQFPQTQQSPLGFTSDQRTDPFNSFPQLSADRFDSFQTTPAPKSLSGSTSNSGQSRPDFTGSSPSRPELTGNTLSRPLDFNLSPHPARPDLMGNRPDFASRFPIAGLSDDQLQQNSRAPLGSFPFPSSSPRQERPLAADFPGFIPGNSQQLTPERLQLLAQERMQQMARSPPDQFSMLGFGSDRFAADQPSISQVHPNGGVIRPMDRINGGQHRPEPEFPNMSPGFPPRQAGSAQFIPQTAFDDPMRFDGNQFTQATRLPIIHQRETKSTAIPFWMQGSSNINSMVPQPRILQQHGKPAEMTTHPGNVLDFETSAASGLTGNDVTGSFWEDNNSRAPSVAIMTQTRAATTTTTTSPAPTTTGKLPWWLQDGVSNSSSSNQMIASGSSKVSLAVSSLDRNPSMYPTFAKPADTCERQKCKLPDCWCGGAEIPGGIPVGETPQVIMLTFDDAVTNQNYHLYTSIFNENRRNPNNCPIRGTFYVSHEWTEYFLVQNLYSDGHEIGSHSVSHTLPGKNFTKNDWADEIAGQREILQRFANVKPEDVKGMRAPYLQTGGNSQFQMLWEKGFLYDSSMSVAENNPPMWPYTLDHAIPHKCWIPPCPTKSFPELWEVPLVHWEDLLGYRCAMADACHNPGDADEVYQLLMNNFKRHYETNRAPFGMYYHSAWFIHNYHMDGFKKFLDTVLSMPDVWILTASQAIQWIQNPTPLSVINHFEPWNCANLNRPAQCNKPNVCPTFFRGGMRYIRTCEACPESYPWIKNTNGASRVQPNAVSTNAA